MEDLERILSTLAPGEGPVLQKSLGGTAQRRRRTPEAALARATASARGAQGARQTRAVSGVYRNTARSLL